MDDREQRMGIFVNQRPPDTYTISSVPIIHKDSDRDCSIRDLIHRDCDLNDLNAISTDLLEAETESQRA